MIRRNFLKVVGGGLLGITAILPKNTNILKRIVEVEKLNIPNRNGRIYTSSLANKIVKSFEELPSRSVLGVPAENFTLATAQSGSKIFLSEASHLVDKMWVDGDYLMAEIEFLETPNGKIIQTFENLDFRLAGIGIGPINGVIHEDSYKFITLIASNDRKSTT